MGRSRQRRERNSQFRVPLEQKWNKQKEKRERRRERRLQQEQQFDHHNQIHSEDKMTYSHGTTYTQAAPVVRAATSTPLMPHKADPKHLVMNFGVGPKLFDHVAVTPEALEKMILYVRMCSEEIGWLGTVQEEGSTLIIDNVYLFEQEVSAAQTDLDENAMAGFANQLLEQDPDNAFDILNRMRMWGHSHVNMGVTPSGTDDTTMKSFAKDIAGTDKPYMVRLIANKKGAMKIDIYYYDKSLVTLDVPWFLMTEVEDIADEVFQEMQSKVKRRTYTANKSSTNTAPTHGAKTQSQVSSTGSKPSTNVVPHKSVDNSTPPQHNGGGEDREAIQDFYKRLKDQGFDVDGDKIEHTAH
jgi:hypothetical protein